VHAAENNGFQLVIFHPCF